MIHSEARNASCTVSTVPKDRPVESRLRRDVHTSDCLHPEKLSEIIIVRFGGEAASVHESVHVDKH